MAILGTKVVVANDQNQLSLSLLNGLQIDPTGPDGKGIRIYTPGTVQAGVILNIHGTLRTGGTSCVANAASSADGPTRYTRNEPNGYTVNKTDLLPEVPSVGPSAAIVGGPVYSIRGKFTGGGAPRHNPPPRLGRRPVSSSGVYDDPRGHSLIDRSGRRVRSSSPQIGRPPSS